MLITTLLALLAATAVSAQTDLQIDVMSLNIRYGSADDGDNDWSHRRELLFETLRSEPWDFIGLQEALPFQIEEIQAALPGYQVYYRTREEDPTRGEACAIFYRAQRWLLDAEHSSTFWLSETPEVVGSRSWDAALPRIATWARFIEKESGTAVEIVNTHFDHRGEVARLESARLLSDRIHRRQPTVPLVLMGDFNAGESSAAMQALYGSASAPRLVDTWRVLHPESVVAGTFGGWQGRTDGPKIDAILVEPTVTVLEAEILRTHEQGRYPSDHYPVTARLEVTKGREGLQP